MASESQRTECKEDNDVKLSDVCTPHYFKNGVPCWHYTVRHDDDFRTPTQKIYDEWVESLKGSEETNE